MKLPRSAWLVVALAVACGGQAKSEPEVGPGSTPPEAQTPEPVAEPARREVFSSKSAKLSEFHGRSVEVVGTILLPPNHDPERRLPINYYIHGFGGGHDEASFRRGNQWREAMDRGELPPMIHVFLDANWSTGHHVFADSATNGPWGAALTEEFIPALEEKFGGPGSSDGRFVSGHSSGGWSSLWLQVRYPEVFGGVWSSAPDPVDFRDFTGIDIYAHENAYEDPEGQPVMLVRRRGKFVKSFEEYARREVKTKPVGGQMYSFDAVFSPAGEGGHPKRLFDRESGAIDSEVAEAWKAYDISLILRSEWERLGPQLAGDLHVWVGTEDTFRLEGAVKLLDAELDELDSDASIVFAEGRDHSTLKNPHPDLWPDGMWIRAAREMNDTFAERLSR